MSLRPKHLKRRGANLGHEIAPDALAHECQSLLALAGIMQTNGLAQLGEFALNQRLYFGDRLMLRRVNDCHFQFGNRWPDLARGNMINVEVFGVAGEEIAALSRFGDANSSQHGPE